MSVSWALFALSSSGILLKFFAANTTLQMTKLAIIPCTVLLETIIFRKKFRLKFNIHVILTYCCFFFDKHYIPAHLFFVLFQMLYALVRYNWLEISWRCSGLIQNVMLHECRKIWNFFEVNVKLLLLPSYHKKKLGKLMRVLRTAVSWFLDVSQEKR